MGNCQTLPQSEPFEHELSVTRNFNPFFETQATEGAEMAILSKYRFISNYEDRFLGRCSVISSA
jgi:hypothetical protein